MTAIGADAVLREKRRMTTSSSSALDDAHAVSRRITLLSVATAVVLVVLKAFALGASGSVSILATLADSSLDLIASLVAFVAVRYAAAPADEEHRHGHGKAEALASMVQSGLILASAAFIGWEAIHRMFNPQPVTAGGWAVSVVILSIVVTAGLVWFQTQALKKTKSLAVAGDRAHYAADMAANVVVLIGVVSGAFLQAPGLDAAAGLVVAIWLFWGAVNLMRTTADHLLDRAVPDAERARIVTVSLQDPRIGGVHQLRTRMVGQSLQIQMHMDLAASLTLAQAHDIVVEAENRILEAFPHADILIHMDPREGASQTQTRDDPDTPGLRPGPWA